MKKEWVLTQDAFDQLLDWPGSDRDRAAARYEDIRRRLIKVFGCRSCLVAEELTDETIDRVSRKLIELAGTALQECGTTCISRTQNRNILGRIVICKWGGRR